MNKLCELYAIFVDLTKAFDSVDRMAVREILLMIGCLRDFVNTIRSFHEGMRATVVENGEMSPYFEIEKLEETYVATLERKRAARKYGMQPGSRVESGHVTAAAETVLAELGYSICTR